jgi:hypothetical protein
MDDSFVARDKISIIIFGSSASVTRHSSLTQDIIPGHLLSHLGLAQYVC